MNYMALTCWNRPHMCERYFGFDCKMNGLKGKEAHKLLSSDQSHFSFHFNQNVPCLDVVNFTVQ